MKTKPCIKHDYKLYNNQHYLPASDIDLGSQCWEWRLVKVCEECGQTIDPDTLEIIKN